MRIELARSPFVAIVLSMGMLAFGCGEGAGGAAPDRVDRPAVTTAPRTPPVPQQPSDDPAGRLCGDDADCHSFFALYNEFTPLARELLDHSNTGDYGTGDLLLAARAQELSSEMQRLACGRKSRIKDMCSELKTIARDMTAVHSATQKAYSNLLRRTLSECQKTQRVYARSVEREVADVDDQWDSFSKACEDYFSAVIAPGAPKASARSESLRLANSIVDMFSSDIETCGQARTRAAVAQCASKSQGRMCDEARAFASEHGWDTVRWIASNAELLPMEWPRGLAVKTVLSRCR